jgi:hypothetical protein
VVVVATVVGKTSKHDIAKAPEHEAPG